MNFFQKYKEYLTDNPEGCWFKRKLYGWGWTPVKWQGWVVTLAFVVFLIWNALRIERASVGGEATSEQVFWFLAQTVVAVAVLIAIAWRTGESPKWQWGIPKEKENTLN